MNPAYIPIFIMLLLVFIMLREQKQMMLRQLIRKRNPEDKIKMTELAKRFIDKECVIYSFDSSHQYDGIIKEVTDGAMLIEKEGKLEAINLDFVIRIREYPRNKNGKKKSVVLD